MRPERNSSYAYGFLLVFILSCLTPETAFSIPLIPRDGGVLTFDPVTGREWLDLTASTNLSIDDVRGPLHNCNPTCTTGPFTGFTFASELDVQKLIENAGIPFAMNTFDLSSPLAMDILELINLLGPTVSGFSPLFGQETRISGVVLPPTPFGPFDALSSSHITGGSLFEAQANTAFSPFSSDIRSDQVGVWLFRAEAVVPEPSTFGLLATALVAALACARAKGLRSERFRRS